MHENDFDAMIDEVAHARGAYWDPDSKVRLFARFLHSRQPHPAPLLTEWRAFLERQADDEAGEEEVDDGT